MLVLEVRGLFAFVPDRELFVVCLVFFDRLYNEKLRLKISPLHLRTFAAKVAVNISEDKQNAEGMRYCNFKYHIFFFF